MALDNNGVLYIWGSNLYDQLGLSNYEYSTVPKRLMSGVKHIYAGDRGSYVIKEDNTLWFWGTFYKSEKKKVYKSPIKIADNVIMVSAYTEQSPSFIKSDNTLWVCDFNLSATKVADDVKYVTGSTDRGFYIKPDGSLWGWGRNDHGQIGDGTINEWPYTTIDEAVKVMDNVVKVSAEWDYTLALTEDGNVWGWGNNKYGNIDPYNCWKFGDSDDMSYDIPKPMLIWECIKKPHIDSLGFLSSNINVGIGEVLPVQLRVFPSDAYYESLEWKSLDESVATVSQHGVFTGVSEGVAKIVVTVTAENGEQFVENCQVTVPTYTSIKEVSTSNCHVRVNDGILHIGNISVGTHIRVFDSSGIMLYDSDAKAQNISIPIKTDGVLIVKIGNETTKVIVSN